MPATQLTTRRIEKIWGRRTLGLGFSDVGVGDDPVGEIWFQGTPRDPNDLLVKYLFTSEKLSIQVHPDDEQAQRHRKKSGKEECWVILDADPGAMIGIGLTQEMDAESLRSAALDGSIEGLLDWKPVSPGDIFYLPAGTIHAIGAGVTLVEVQQNTDVTYRLYDYGRPRDLHLDEAIDVARREPWHSPSERRMVRAGRTVLAEGRKFVLECWEGGHSGRLDPAPGRPLWLAPLTGLGLIGGQASTPGTVWVVDEALPFTFEGDILIAYPGGEVVPDLIW